MTNFERIKGMSVEDLARQNVRFSEYDYYYLTSDGKMHYEESEAIKHEVEWLESEAEE